MAQEPAKKKDHMFLDEDDDFEEFLAEEWMVQDEDSEDKQAWEDNWDDDKVDDDFSVQLRAELEKLGHKVSTTDKAWSHDCHSHDHNTVLSAIYRRLHNECYVSVQYILHNHNLWHIQEEELPIAYASQVVFLMGLHFKHVF